MRSPILRLACLVSGHPAETGWAELMGCSFQCGDGSDLRAHSAGVPQKIENTGVGEDCHRCANGLGTGSYGEWNGAERVFEAYYDVA